MSVEKPSEPKVAPSWTPEQETAYAALVRCGVVSLPTAKVGAEYCGAWRPVVRRSSHEWLKSCDARKAQVAARRCVRSAPAGAFSATAPIRQVALSLARS